MIPVRPSKKALTYYALQAVRSEVANPAHGRLSSYNRQSAMVDVLNHFEALTNSDDDEDLIEEAVRAAELIVDPDGGL